MYGADGKVESGTHLISDPDAYKTDWNNSMVFKRAMKTEAIKRGQRVDSDWECEEDDDKVEMTATHCESKWVPQKEGDPNDSDDDSVHFGNAQDIDEMQGNNIGFMKSFNAKGNIKMLTENEIQYLKTFLKQQNENEMQDRNDDLFRHCKFTIRKLTR